MSNPTVVDETLSESIRDLAREAARKFEWSTVRIRPLYRYGYSGARVFVIRPDLPRYVPHVLKIATRRQIDDEMRAIESCGANIKDMPRTYRFTTKVREPDGTKLGGITYVYYENSADSHAAVDLTDVYAACMTPPSAGGMPEAFDVRLAGLLARVFDQLSTAHVVLPKQRSRQYADALGSYLRPKRDSRVERVLRAAAPTEIHGVTIDRNPLALRDDLQTQYTTGFDSVIVHGDLHLSNVVIDGSSAPRLIDFAWAQSSGHLLVDFVLLESSLRFMSFPHDVSPTLVMQVDRELNSQRDPAAAESIAASVADVLTRHRLQQMIAAVTFVRAAAGKAMGGWHSPAWLEYQRVLYLVLSGQERLNDFPLMRTIVALDQLAKQLSR